MRKQLRGFIAAGCSRSFWQGFLYEPDIPEPWMDWKPTPHPFDPNQDLVNLSKDWQAVGQDLWKAVRAYEHERKPEHRELATP